MRRIGILGGTFNPVHNGHLSVALNLVIKLSLDLFYLVPSSNPPHKVKDILPFEIRKNMLELAIESHPYLRISDLDHTHDKKSYTKHLIERFRKDFTQDELFFIIGADNIPQLSNWYDYRWLLDNINIVAVNRPGQDLSNYSHLEYFKKLTIVETSPVDVSSADIRKKLANNDAISGLVPPAVEEFIKKNHLYFNCETV